MHWLASIPHDALHCSKIGVAEYAVATAPAVVWPPSEEVEEDTGVAHIFAPDGSSGRPFAANEKVPDSPLGLRILDDAVLAVGPNAPDRLLVIADCRLQMPPRLRVQRPGIPNTPATAVTPLDKGLLLDAAAAAPSVLLLSALPKLLALGTPADVCRRYGKLIVPGVWTSGVDGIMALAGVPQDCIQ